MPPAISTLPFGSSVAVAPPRAVFITGVEAGAANVLVTGSYSSVLLRAPAIATPPAISTLPLGSSVAVAFSRAAFITGVEAGAANVLVTGSYSSVLLRGTELPAPPASITLPSGSSVAVASSRAAFITGVLAANIPVSATG